MGFNLPNGDYFDEEDQTTTSGNTGLYLGVNGDNGLPVFHLNTGIANGSRSLYFDGVQLKIENVDLVSSADGQFDDLGVDSLTGNRLYAIDLGFKNLFAVSDYVQLDVEGRPIIDIDTFDARKYFCWIYGCKKKVDSPRVFAPVGFQSATGIRLQTYLNNYVVPFDYPDLNTKYRMKKKEISFSIKFSLSDSFREIEIQPLYSILRFYIFDDTQSFDFNFEQVSPSQIISGYAGNYLAKLDLSFTGYNLQGGEDIYNQSDYYYAIANSKFKNYLGQDVFDVEYVYSGDVPVVYTDINNDEIATIRNYAREITINCNTDNEALNYIGSRRLRVGVEYLRDVGNFNGSISAVTSLQFMLIDKPKIIDAENDKFDWYKIVENKTTQ